MRSTSMLSLEEKTHHGGETVDFPATANKFLGLPGTRSTAVGGSQQARPTLPCKCEALVDVMSGLAEASY